MPRFRRRRQSARWTAQLFDRTSVVTGTENQSIIVDVTDYASNTNIEPDGPILARVRGFLTLVPQVSSWTFFCGLFVVDRDSPGGSYDPINFQNLVDEEPLWWWSYSVGIASASFPIQPVQIELDIKAKRRLKDSDLILAWNSTGTAGAAALLTGTFRALMTGNRIT